MLPLKLTLKNFLSYGNDTQEIIFEGRSLIYLSGDNGHGKSALLESLTWSIWGFARKSQGSTKNDDALIRLGSSDMFVSIEFLIRNDRYLIKRSCERKNKKITTELNFFFFNEDGQLISLTGTSQKETQESINTVIGFDYETFINTVFLRQGNSNEFSKKTPKERKEILCNILGINQIEDIRQRALDDLKKINIEISGLNSFISTFITEVNEEELSLKKENLYNQKEIYLNQKEENIKKRKHFEEFEKELKNKINLLLMNSEEEKKEIHELNNINTNFRKNHTEYIKIKNIIKEIKLLEKEKKFLNIDLFDLKKLKNDIEIIELEYKKENENYQKNKNLIELEFNKNILLIDQNINLFNENKLKIKNEIDEIEKNLLNFEKNLSNLNKNKNKLNELILNKDLIIKKISKIEKIKSKIKFLKSNLEKKILYNNSIILNCNNIDFKNCPLCKSLLNEDLKNNINKKSKKEIGILDLNLKKIIIRENFINNKNHIFEEKLNNILKEELNLKKIIDDNIDIEIINEKNKNEFILKKNEYESINFKLNDFIKNKNDLSLNFKSNINLINKNYLKIENEYILKIKNLKNILDKNIELDKLNFTLNRLNDDFKKYNLKEIRLILKNIIKELKEKKIKIKNLKIFHDKISEEIKNEEKELFILSNELKEKELNMHDFYNFLIKEHTEYTLLEKQKEEMQNKKIKIEKEYNNLNIEANYLNKFISILSKDELQAILIEESIPLIEEEANHILNMLTEGKYNIQIESMRDLKSGKSKETLDIIISDSSGLRQYEFFSGGEAFRIDLSLRIALAKVLANRSGSSMRMLIIDEGFGSQDGVSLEAIVNALHILQNEFNLIIIVSHLQELKDSFSTNFVVQKTITGSKVTMFEY